MTALFAKKRTKCLEELSTFHDNKSDLKKSVFNHFNTDRLIENCDVLSIPYGKPLSSKNQTTLHAFVRGKKIYEWKVLFLNKNELQYCDAHYCNYSWEYDKIQNVALAKSGSQFRKISLFKAMNWGTVQRNIRILCLRGFHTHTH